MGSLIALVVLGFGMATLGVALLFLGEVPFVAGKRIPSLRSRLIGTLLAGFLPLAILVRQASNLLFGPDVVESIVLTWSLFGLCWFAVFVILFRVVVPKGAPRRATKQKASAEAGPPKVDPKRAQKKPEPASESLAWMDAEPELEPAKKPAPVKKPASKKADDDNPFNFS